MALAAFPARADPYTPWRIAFITAEILTPDFRLELAPGVPARWLLSWPIAPFALNLEWPRFNPETHDEYLSSWVNFEVEPFVEPQLVIGAGLWRGLAGARLAIYHSSSSEWGLRPGLLLEGTAREDRRAPGCLACQDGGVRSPWRLPGGSHICRRHCLHCTREYNVRANEARRDPLA